jgi:4-hydroxybenzoate polyprenyltransferase
MAVEPPLSHAPSSGAATVTVAAGWREYLQIARVDHWVKHVFIVPGLVLAGLLGAADRPEVQVLVVLAGLLAAALASSANYVINEFLDAPFDAHHPTKSARASVRHRMSPAIVAVEYLVLAAVSLGIGFAIALPLGWTIAAFLASGIVYNIRPLRSKDVVFWDVATEAINNPIRLTIGWLLIDPTTLPPSSLLFAYWAGGAFLMSTKRMSEYRTIVADGGTAVLERYRRSFRHYTEQRLLLQSFAYAQLASFFLAVFLVKYRIEYVISFPLFAALFVVYLRIGLKAGSSAAAPERLYRERSLMLLVAIIAIAFATLTFVDLPILESLAQPYLIPIAP